MVNYAYFAIEVFGVLILVLVLIGLYTRREKTKSSRALVWASWANFLCTGANALMYINYGPEGPLWLLWTMCVITYVFGNITMLLFAYYDSCYLREYAPLSKRTYHLPIGICILNFFLSIYSVWQGDVFASSTGVYTETEGLPVVIFLLYFLCMVYMPIPAIMRHKELGAFKCLMFCLFSMFPLMTLILYAFEITDYCYASGSVSILAMYMFLENQLVQDKDNRLREEMSAHQIDLENAKAEAEAANQAKTAFLFNMSHDIRTPMNAILGFSDLIEKKKDDPEAIADYVSKLKSSGVFLLSLINNVLNMAHIESGKMELDEQPIDLLARESNPIVQFVEEAKKKNQTLTWSDNIQHRYVRIDILKVHEVMNNLLSNAIKYTPEGGAIDIRFEEVPSDRPGYATFKNIVSDTGIGMTPQFQDNIYDLFSRERNTTDSKVIGTGLGMSIVKKLVDLMNGSIEITSELGKGTTIVVTLSHPIAEQPDKNRDSRLLDKATKSIAGMRVLLAEDNDLNAEIAISMLEELGVRAERAVDGQDCVDKLMAADANQYDAIIMDIQMPNLNGYAATERIRAFSDTTKANIPIIAMTANVFDEDKENAFKAGMNGHVSKPIIRESLVAELLKVHNI